MCCYTINIVVHANKRGGNVPGIFCDIINSVFVFFMESMIKFNAFLFYLIGSSGLAIYKKIT